MLFFAYIDYITYNRDNDGYLVICFDVVDLHVALVGCKMLFSNLSNAISIFFLFFKSDSISINLQRKMLKD